MSEIPRQIFSDSDVVGRTIAKVEHCSDDCTPIAMALLFTDGTFALYAATGDDYDGSGGYTYLDTRPIDTAFGEWDVYFNEFKVAIGLRTQQELDEFDTEQAARRKAEMDLHFEMKAAEERRKRLTDPAQYPTLVAKGLWVPESMK